MGKLRLSTVRWPGIEGDQFVFSRKAYAKDFDGLMNPLIGIEHFEMTGDVMRTHPDLGVNSITYIFETSSPYLSRDLLGNEINISPGTMCWTYSAEGIVHREFPNPNKALVEGIQIYLGESPENQTIAKSGALVVRQIPELTRDGLRVKVVAGSSGEVANGIETPVPFTFLHIFLEQLKEFNHILPANWSGTVMVIEGRLYVSTQEETIEMEEGMVLSLSGSETNEPITFTGITGCEVIVVSGERVSEEDAVGEKSEAIRRKN